jgi:hypothetical protein
MTETLIDKIKSSIYAKRLTHMIDPGGNMWIAAPEIYDLIRQHELMETPAIPVPLETGEFAEYPNKAKAGASANQTLIDLLHEITGVVLARKNDRAWSDNTPYYDGLITRLQAAQSTLKSIEISDNEPSGYHYDNFRYENKSIPSEISDNTTEVLWVKQPVTEMTEEEAEYWRQHQPTNELSKAKGDKHDRD